MIDKIPQSQNLMNAIHLQVKLKGDKLERSHVLEILKTAHQNADRVEAEEKADLKAQSVACGLDLALFQNHTNENNKWEFTVNRHKTQNQRVNNQIQAFIDRTLSEKNDYDALAKIIQTSWTQWQSFQNFTISQLEKVNGLIHRARSQIRKLASGAKGSFLQLSENSVYFTNLNEIRVTFESTSVELQGFRPLVTKLLQLMAKPEAVNKEEVRVKLLALFKKISGEIQNIRDEVEANKARQDAIFSAILESYKENVIRINKLLERLNQEHKAVVEDAVTLAESAKDAIEITKVSRAIFTSRKSQCINYIENITHLATEIQKTRSIVAQLNEILEERFGKLKSYFLQRDMKMLKN